jgi:hypothetical protein
MQDWIIFILVLFIALTVSFITASKTDFIDYVFVPFGWNNRMLDSTSTMSSVPWRPMHGPWRQPWWRRPWWRRERWVGPRYQYVTYLEPFTDKNKNETKPKDEIEYSEDIQAKMKKHEMEMLRLSPENMSNSAMPDLFTQKPYHLLADEYQPVEPEKISCVNSRNCYATSFDRFLEQTGNFRQMTNNYQRGYPDSCSSPFQELVLSFYKTSPMKMDRPTNCL